MNLFICRQFESTFTVSTHIDAAKYRKAPRFSGGLVLGA